MKRFILPMLLAMTVPAAAQSLQEKWGGVSAAMTASPCKQTPACAAILNTVSDMPLSLRVRRVNGLVNDLVRYTPEDADAWDGPLETLATHKGDCEDYAILKYFILRASGMEPSDLRVLVGLTKGDWHAVLATRVDGEWIVLNDNSRTVPTVTAIAPYFTPKFSLSLEFGVQGF